jgi:hypothetical protein
MEEIPAEMRCQNFQITGISLFSESEVKHDEKYLLGITPKAYDSINITHDLKLLFRIMSAPYKNLLKLKIFNYIELIPP